MLLVLRLQTWVDCSKSSMRRCLTALKMHLPWSLHVRGYQGNKICVRYARLMMKMFYSFFYKNAECSLNGRHFLTSNTLLLCYLFLWADDFVTCLYANEHFRGLYMWWMLQLSSLKWWIFICYICVINFRRLYICWVFRMYFYLEECVTHLCDNYIMRFL